MYTIELGYKFLVTYHNYLQFHEGDQIIKYNHYVLQETLYTICKMLPSQLLS